ncbi:hypothetical protein [Sabulicella rubraurantiaca]|uniref:hypothetical protein n=1 Tax=Sabulicella rubraurantiaca TaxID=2811429 RepID=UPI001A970DAA|nr:hypothetical protein [Sabulicella rubraurantiaca]
MRVEEARLAELARLVEALERLAPREGDQRTRALIAVSRQLLAEPTRRRADLGPKLLALGALLADAVALALAMVSLLAPDARLLVPSVLWLLWRLRRLAWLGEEAALFLWDMAAQGWDWLAEAFSHRAAQRLEARLAATVLLRRWRRHEAASLDKPQVEDFLAGFGARTLGGWQAHAAAQEGGAARRLRHRRASALRRAFREMALDGAFRPEAVPPPPPPVPSPAAPGPDPAEQARREAKRAGIAALLRRKRAEVDQAHGWKLKTPAEHEQRDRHLATLRGEIAALEAEAKALS